MRRPATIPWAEQAGQWASMISHGGTLYRLGLYLTEVEAACAFDEVAKALGRQDNGVTMAEVKEVIRVRRKEEKANVRKAKRDQRRQTASACAAILRACSCNRRSLLPQGASLPDPPPPGPAASSLLYSGRQGETAG